MKSSSRNGVSRATLALMMVALLIASPGGSLLAQQPGASTPHSRQETQSSWVRALSITQREAVVEVQVPPIALQQVETEGKTFQRLVSPESGHTTAVGKPELPTFGRYVAVPIGAEITVEILDSQSTTYSGVMVYPAQPPQPDCQGYQIDDFSLDVQFYEQDVVYPGQPAIVQDRGQLRDITYALLQFYPAQYNPARQELTLYSYLKVRITFSGEESGFTDGRYRAENFERIYRRLFLNYEAIESSPARPAGTIHATGADYLIITAPNFVNPAQDLAEWKTRRGIQTVVKTTDETGSTLAEIDNYIQNAYDTWSPRPAYVLLLGDAEFIPVHYVTTHSYHGTKTGTDLYYLTTSGSDYMPDIAGARIPASTEEEARRIVDNILAYEQDPPSDSSFYDRFQVAAYFQDDNNNGTADRLFTQTSEEIHDFLEDTKSKTATRCYTTNSSNPQYYYYGDPVPVEVRTALLQHSVRTCITNDMNQGRFILNHRDHGIHYGWGDPEYFIFDIRGLSYADPEELPVVFSINCETNWFDSETDEEGCSYVSSSSFSEEFLMQEKAIAVFGATRVSYSWYNDALVKGYYDGIWSDMLGFSSGSPFQDGLYRLGDALGWGKAYLLTQYPPPDSTTLTTMEIHHLMGDPTLEIWTDVPQSMSVAHAATAPAGATNLDVDVNVAGAAITIVQNGSIIGQVTSSVSGNNPVALSPAAADGPMYVTVTRHNYIPYQGTVDVGNTHTISGCVRDGGTGVENVWIGFRAGVPAARTDASGCYNRKVADGTYTVTAENERWTIWPGSQQVTVSGADVSSVDFQAEPFGARPGYSTSFDDGRLGPAWTIEGTTYGRAGTLDCPHSGDYAVILDEAGPNTPSSDTAAVILSADLACRSDAAVTFWWRDAGDEDHASDGVYIRRNAADSWCGPIFSFTGDQTSYTEQTIDLNIAANGCWGSPALTSEFQIKFQQYDNFYWNPTVLGSSDGIAIDDVSITASGGTYTWDGSTNSKWNEPTNWDVGCVPSPIDDVVIPSGVSNWPNINALAYAHDLTIQDGAQLDALTSATLNIYGDWIEQGSGYLNGNAGTVIFGDTAVQSISASAGSHFYNLQIGDGQSSSALAPTGNLDVNGNLTIMPGASLNGGSHTYRIAGNWDCQGGFAPGSSSIIFDGGTIQTATSSAGMTTNTYDSTDVPKPIPNGQCVDSTLDVSLSASTGDVDVTIGRISHPRDGDLDIYIRHPDATEVMLSTANGGNGDHYIDTVFDDEATNPITSGAAPFTGQYQPEGSLSSFDGKSASGVWTLHVCDHAAGQVGTLEAWSLSLSTIAAGTEFHNLAVASGTTLNLDGDTTVQGNLLVETGGLLDISTHSLEVNGTVTNNGGLRQTRDTPDLTTTSFLNIPIGKYYGVDIYPTSGDMGATTVTVYGNQACPNSDTAILRCFEIEPGTDRTADITYYYRNLEENGQDAADPWHWNGSSWDQETCAGRDRSGVENNWVQASGVDQYSPFGLFNNPTAVDLVRFEARPTDGATHLEWETATEIDNLGFNLYRATSAPEGERIRLNADLIPSQAPGSPVGAVYVWLDELVETGTPYYYWLEDVDVYGETTLHGPVSATTAELPLHRVYLPLVQR